MAENASLKAHLLGLIPPLGTILDVGCGTGFMLDLVGSALEPRQYLGVDISVGMLNHARGKHVQYRFQHDDAEALHSVPSDSVTLYVALFGVLPYCRKERFFREVRRVLEPNGRFLVLAYERGHVLYSASDTRAGIVDLATEYDEQTLTHRLEWTFKDIRCGRLTPMNPQPGHLVVTGRKP